MIDQVPVHSPSPLRILLTIKSEFAKVPVAFNKVKLVTCGSSLTIRLICSGSLNPESNVVEFNVYAVSSTPLSRRPASSPKTGASFVGIISSVRVA